VSGGMSREQLYQEVEQQTGLQLPGDIETLLGSSAAFSVGKGVDLANLAEAAGPNRIPMAVTVQGDPAEIEKVLNKVRGHLPPAARSLLGSDSSGDLVAIGPDGAYRKQIIGGGHLGDTDTFRGVVPDAGRASSLLYLNIDELQSSISQAAGGDQQVIDNVRPLRAFGLSTWNDGNVMRTSFQISTN
jgi:hypothetical protein